MEKNKRERNVNFTEEETDLLVLLAGARKHIIESKKSDAATWQEKEKAWRDIETAFNVASRSVFRDHKHLKFKYEALKRDARKKSRIESYKTDGGTRISPVLTPAEKTVKDIILSVEGNEISRDSDVVMPCTFKYEALKSDARQKSQIDSFKTDGGMYTPPVLTPGEKTEKEMILSIEGSESSHESDVFIPCKFKNEALKRDARKKSRVDSSKIDSGTSICPVLTSAEKTVKEMIFRPVEGNESSNHDYHDSVVVMPCEPKERKPLDALIEEKLEIAKIQKQIAMEELREKLLQRKMLEKELEHKEIMRKLEKQHLLLKIELLKKSIGEVKKC